MSNNVLVTCKECMQKGKACDHYLTYARNWVLHRLLGHHPTNPNLKRAGITKDTPAFNDAIDHMLLHRTYITRILSYVDQDTMVQAESYTIADMAIAIITEKTVCPFCGVGY